MIIACGGISFIVQSRPERQGWERKDDSDAFGEWE